MRSRANEPALLRLPDTGFPETGYGLHAAATDAGLTAQQRDLLREIEHALAAIRTMLSSHPDAADRVPPAVLSETLYCL